MTIRKHRTPRVLRVVTEKKDKEALIDQMSRGERVQFEERTWSIVRVEGIRCYNSDDSAFIFTFEEVKQ